MIKILIIGYSGFSPQIMRIILEPEGYEVIEAADGIVGLERYFLDKPALVILNMTMEMMHSLEVIEKLRQMDPEARVVVTTADIQSSTRTLVEAAGAKGLIHRHLKREEVLKVVAEALKG